jgi:hypothetical protein
MQISYPLFSSDMEAERHNFGQAAAANPPQLAQKNRILEGIRPPNLS